MIILRYFTNFYVHNVYGYCIFIVQVACDSFSLNEYDDNDDDAEEMMNTNMYTSTAQQ